MSTAWYLLFTTHQDYLDTLCSNIPFKMTFHCSLDQINPLFPNLPSHSIYPPHQVILKLGLSTPDLNTDKFKGSLDAKHCQHLLGVKQEMIM